jgi:NitT/TauT family transport system ATP-binding protein
MTLSCLMKCSKKKVNRRYNTMESQTTVKPKIVIERVYKVFKTTSGAVRALDNISLSIRNGEFLCIVGPSGCGKSTLLNLIAGLEFPNQGHLYLDGKPITQPGSDRMVMFQESALFPWLNVMENVLFGLKLKKNLSESERIEIATFYLQLVKLDRFMYSNIHELSGGMKQRVALARALAPNPEVLLMDEPFAALDAMTREELYTEIQEIWEDQNKTIVFVTHNVAEAACLGDRVVLFSPYPGKIKEQFEINLPRPRDIRDLEVAKHASDITHVLRHHLPPPERFQ